MSTDLSKLSTSELGHLFPIIITDYNPEWPEIYIAEKRRILRCVGSEMILRMEHIGSTAVPGLCAKPTIDILIEIPDNADCELLIRKLQTIQYDYIPKPENPSPHMMFARGYSPEGVSGQTYHIHIRYAGDWDEILFRDYLIKNPDIAREYCTLKRRLASEYTNDREIYTNSKTDFITGINKRARDELKY